MSHIKKNKHYGYSLFRDFSAIHRHSQIYLISKLKEKDMLDCHPPVLFTILFHEGLSQNELASILHFNKGAIAKLVKSLEEKGYIKRETDEKDKRVHRLYLTDYGRSIIPVLNSFEKEWSDKLIDNMTSDEVATLENLLNKILNNIIRKEK